MLVCTRWSISDNCPHLQGGLSCLGGPAVPCGPKGGLDAFEAKQGLGVCCRLRRQKRASDGKWLWWHPDWCRAATAERQRDFHVGSTSEDPRSEHLPFCLHELCHPVVKSSASGKLPDSKPSSTAGQMWALNLSVPQLYHLFHWGSPRDLVNELMERTSECTRQIPTPGKLFLVQEPS